MCHHLMDPAQTQRIHELFRLVADGANIVVPDAPGLGVEVDESLLRPPSDSTREFSLRRNDGSITNW